MFSRSGGLILLLTSRRAALRDAGLLLLFAGGSSMIFGALYGSCFGLEQFKKYALWHDPLAGDPMSLMLAAIEIGIVLISLGLILNIINHLRHGDFIGALLDKFGAAGAVFYWGALALAAKSAAIRAHGLFTPLILLLAALALAWMLKEPLELAHRRNFSVAQIFNLLYRRIAFGRTRQTRESNRPSPPGGLQIRDTAECNSALPRNAAESHDTSTVVMESFVNVFEGLVELFRQHHQLRASRRLRHEPRGSAAVSLHDCRRT